MAQKEKKSADDKDGLSGGPDGGDAGKAAGKSSSVTSGPDPSAALRLVRTIISARLRVTNW